MLLQIFMMYIASISGTNNKPGPLAPAESELEAFDKIFIGNLTAFNVEALDILFLDGGKSSSKQPQRHRFGCFSFI